MILWSLLSSFISCFLSFRLKSSSFRSNSTFLMCCMRRLFPPPLRPELFQLFNIPQIRSCVFFSLCKISGKAFSLFPKSTEKLLYAEINKCWFILFVFAASFSCFILIYFLLPSLCFMFSLLKGVRLLRTRSLLLLLLLRLIVWIAASFCCSLIAFKTNYPFKWIKEEVAIKINGLLIKLKKRMERKKYFLCMRFSPLSRCSSKRKQKAAAVSFSLQQTANWIQVWK